MGRRKKSKGEELEVQEEGENTAMEQMEGGLFLQGKEGANPLREKRQDNKEVTKNN